MRDIEKGHITPQVLSKVEKPINYDYVKNVYENMFRYLAEVGYYNKDGYFTFSAGKCHIQEDIKNYQGAGGKWIDTGRFIEKISQTIR